MKDKYVGKITDITLIPVKTTTFQTCTIELCEQWKDEWADVQQE